ncbi:helix-turn-helix domain-containing protein [Parasphingopyxis sp.]|uniref:winged helix-turn-helix transcriptional regulator n=1 Tax=Parasphingopyxis sp. TaxID=1920299 RepID=UPI00262CC779|nr:helix-turn-helix domain-containing protein [Parasphingopyxis sp.]
MGKLTEPLGDIGDDECGLPCALQAMGERWSFMILRACFNGLKHFEEMQSNLGIARNILANRLGRLVESEILERQPCADDRRKIEYKLTEKGEALLPAMIALRQWGEQWGIGVPSNPVLCDQRDRQPVQQIRVHAHDGRPLDWHDLLWVDQSEVVAEAAE